ncbi:hypothetical protein M422DRAFT_254612 [Sphaerobolus stellatus SS14]|uniref:Uncharacterized protein n=1 Tax=Sphaerobolus stellatus (strain SS14) TaxID=990650 RepID=A0A0C9VUF9_SPHS4|nr:hypothetical protein M422DRAFT_254612 [Sphaerobolus stellatus SS14]
MSAGSLPPLPKGSRLFCATKLSWSVLGWRAGSDFVLFGIYGGIVANSSTTTYYVHDHNYTSGVQEAPTDTTLPSDAVHGDSHMESVGIQSVVSGTDYDPIQEPQPPRDPTPPRDDRVSDRTPQQSPRPSPQPPVEGGGGGGGDPNPDHSDGSSDQDWKYKDNVRKGIKLRDPDTYDGSNPEKLQNFLFLCSLVLKSKAKTYKSNMSKIYFALSFLWGAALEYFELAIMADYPNMDDQPVYFPEEDEETALEELKMEKHHQATRFFISFAKYKAKAAYNDHSYYCLVMNAMPNQILEELHRIDQHYWNHKNIMDLHRKGSSKPPAASNTAPSGNNNNNNNNQSGNNKSKDNK